MKGDFYMPNKFKKYTAMLLIGCLMSGFAACTTSDTGSAGKADTTEPAKDSNNSNAGDTSSKDTQNAAQNTDTGTAEEEKDDAIEFDGKEVSSSGTYSLSSSEPLKITGTGTYTIQGSGSMLIVDAPKQDVTLELDNVNLSNESVPPIYIKKAASITLRLKGTNNVSMGSSYEYEPLNAALYSKADLILEGEGTMNLSSGYEHGIKAKDTLQAKGGLWNIQAENDGIHVNEQGTFSGGTWNIDAQGEAIEAKDTLTFQGGTYNLKAADDAINAANAITIDDGTISAVSSGNDAIDSNGDLIINGGSVTAIGLKAPEQAFDTDNTPFEINGGSVLGIGSSLIYPTQTKQPVILAGSDIANGETIQNVEIKSKDNTSIAKWEITDTQSNADARQDGYGKGMSGTNMTLSAPELKSGDTVSIWINGTSAGDLTLTEGVNTFGTVQTMGGRGMGHPGGGQMPAPDGEFDPSSRPENGNFDPANRPDSSKGFRKPPMSKDQTSQNNSDASANS